MKETFHLRSLRAGREIIGGSTHLFGELNKFESGLTDSLQPETTFTEATSLTPSTLMMRSV